MIASSATAGQPVRPEPAGDLALVHLRALGEPRLLGVLGDDAVEGLDVLQGAAHQQRVGDALAVVGEDPHPRGGVGHRAELGQLLAAQADGDRADRVDVAVAGLAAEAPDLLDDAGGVGDRVGVGHRVHGGEAAERGGPGAGLDGLGVLAAGLAQVGVQVDQAGQRDQPVGVDDRRRPVSGGADLGDRRRREQQVDGVALAAQRIDPRTSRHDITVASIGPARIGRSLMVRRPAAEQQVEHGHPDADAVGDLLDDGRAQAVGDLGGDLHAAVHRAGVHDDGVLGQQRHPVDVEAVAAAVLAGAREVGGVHPLALDPQHHHDVGLGQHRVEVVGDLGRARRRRRPAAGSAARPG